MAIRVPKLVVYEEGGKTWQAPYGEGTPNSYADCRDVARSIISSHWHRVGDTVEKTHGHSSHPETVYIFSEGGEEICRYSKDDLLREENLHGTVNR